MAATRWNDLSARSRRLIAAGALAEAALKAAVLIDLRRRPASEIRGSKRAWALAMIVNSAGIIPLSYFAFGRRRTQSAQPQSRNPGQDAAQDDRKPVAT
jgi:hypothetical protein